MNPENKDPQTSNQNSSDNIMPTKERLSIQPPTESTPSTPAPQPVAQPGNVPTVEQTSEVAAQPSVSSAPVTSPPPTGQPATTPNQSFVTSQPLLSRTDIEAKLNKAKRRRLLILSGAGFALIIVGIIAAVLLGLFTSFKTITYDNGDGSKYTMTFYAKYHEENLAYGLEDQIGSDIEYADSSKKLVSKVSKDGKAPLTLAILSGEINGATQAGAFSKIRDCSGGLSESISIHNKTLNRDIKLCSVKTQDGIEYAYMGAFETKNKFNLIQIAHDLNYKDLQNSKDESKLVDSLGMDIYKDDIQQIVESITPLD